MLPFAVHLGVSRHHGLAQSTGLIFLLGLLQDTFMGSSIGLHTFVLVLTCLLARSAVLRLFLRRPIFQVLLTFFASAVAGVMAVVLRSVFENPPPFSISSKLNLSIALFLSSLTTAALSPLIFFSIRRLSGLHKGTSSTKLRI